MVLKMVAYYQPSKWRLPLDTQWYLSEGIVHKLSLNIDCLDRTLASVAIMKRLN